MPAQTAYAEAGLGHELQALYKRWWFFLALGMTLVILGALAIAFSCITSFTSVAAVLILGFLLLAAGITQIVSSFWTGKWSGMLMHMLIGLLYSVTGYMIVDQPGVGGMVLTKLIAIFLIVAG